jgi:hypothetical protein
VREVTEQSSQENSPTKIFDLKQENKERRSRADRKVVDSKPAKKSTY